MSSCDSPPSNLEAAPPKMFEVQESAPLRPPPFPATYTMKSADEEAVKQLLMLQASIGKAFMETTSNTKQQHGQERLWFPNSCLPQPMQASSSMASALHGGHLTELEQWWLNQLPHKLSNPYSQPQGDHHGMGASQNTLKFMKQREVAGLEAAQAVHPTASRAQLIAKLNMEIAMIGYY